MVDIFMHSEKYIRPGHLLGLGVNLNPFGNQSQIIVGGSFFYWESLIWGSNRNPEEGQEEQTKK